MGCSGGNGTGAERGRFRQHAGENQSDCESPGPTALRPTGEWAFPERPAASPCAAIPARAYAGSPGLTGKDSSIFPRIPSSLSQQPLAGAQIGSPCDFFRDLFHIPEKPLPRTLLGTNRNQISRDVGWRSSENVIAACHKTAIDTMHTGGGLGIK